MALDLTPHSLRVGPDRRTDSPGRAACAYTRIARIARDVEGGLTVPIQPGLFEGGLAPDPHLGDRDLLFRRPVEHNREGVDLGRRQFRLRLTVDCARVRASDACYGWLGPTTDLAG